MEGNICQVPQYYDISLTFPNGTNISLSPIITDQTKSGVHFMVKFDDQLKETIVHLHVMPINSAGSNSSDPVPFGKYEDLHTQYARIYNIL